MMCFPIVLRLVGFLGLSFLLCFCQPQTESTPSLRDSVALTKQAPVRLVPLSDSPLFEEAILQCNAPENLSLQAEQVSFSYDIKNFSLTKPTLDGTCASGCANSTQGQHVHLILNNEPYFALYSPEFSKKLEPGSYVALSFLSRSYHESIKHFEAYDLRQFSIGNGKHNAVDLNKPMLFYSRPKGSYTGIEAEHVLLDFFVVNAELSESGFKVAITVDAQTFLCTKWQAYLIEGLANGEHRITLQLINEKGQHIMGRYGRIERTFIVD